MLCGALLIPATGCKLITRSDGTTARVIDADKAAKIVEDAVSVAGWLYLQKNPQDRNKFELAVTGLNALIGGTNYSAIEFAKVLQELPVKQFQGPSGAMTISLVVEVWGGVQTIVTPITEKELVQKTMIAARNGLQAALDSTRPPAPNAALYSWSARAL